MKRNALLIWTFFCTFVTAQQPAPDAVIRPTPAETKLAVAEFAPRSSANSETNSALSVFNKVLLDDLKFSSFFRIPSRSFYPLRSIRTVADVNFENWQVPSLDVDFLIFGNLQVDSTATVVEAFLYDVKTGRQVKGKRYTISDSTRIRYVAHEFADLVVFELTAGASRGIARTRIAYASKQGDSKEIYVMDYDGANPRKVTANGGINKFPEWAPDNSFITFVTNLPGANHWQLWIQSLEKGHRTIPVPASYVSSPAVSSDGTRIAFSSRQRGKMDPDIFVSTLDGGGMTNLTRHPGIDTAPAWSPTGGQIAFISDRSGTPQVWAMDSDGSNLRRLVQEGGHCDSPAWSPDGRLILYSWQAPSQWKHDVYVLEVATGQIFQLTHGMGSSESPHWSPDGRHIAFQNTRTGSKQIFIMNADGKNRKQITTYGVNEGPSWTHYEPNSEPEPLTQ